MAIRSFTERGADGASAPVTDVVFDFCGVLVDWQPARAIAEVADERTARDFASFGDRLGFLYFDDLLDGGADFEETAARYEEERGAALARVFRAYYENVERSLVDFLPGMKQLVLDLRAAGVRCFGLTNWSRFGAGAWSARFPEFDELLDGVLVSGIEGVKKPDAAVFRLAEERFGLTPERTAFFDDNSLNAEAAAQAGWYGLAFIDAAHARADLVRLGALPQGAADDPARVPDDGRAAVDGGACARTPAETADTEAHPVGGANTGSAGVCTARTVHAAPALPQEREETEFELTPLDGEASAAEWHGIALADLVFPALGDDPYDGWNDEAFWLARYKEYRGLEWNRLDWASIRRSMIGAAEQLAAHPEPSPTLRLSASGENERMFMEMWFGYSDPPVAARATGDGRHLITYGQHRICAMADFPMNARDRDLMRIGEHGFVNAPPLPPETLIPVLVRK